MFAVFLDVDGVLNTRTSVAASPEGYKGVDEARVEILSKALKTYGGGKIILTSDWKDTRRNSEDMRYLKAKLAKYGLAIEDKTIDEWHKRGRGIDAYLKQHMEIEEYVILDDCLFDFKDYPKLWERLLLTDGIEKAQTASETPAVETIVFLSYIRKF